MIKRMAKIIIIGLLAGIVLVSLVGCLDLLTGDSVGGGVTGQPTPYVVYVTATPPAVGPYHSTPQAGDSGLAAPTLDLSQSTLVPVPAESGSAEPPSRPEQPTSTPERETLVQRPREGALYSNRFGINFISSAQHETSETRFYAGLDAGAGWDRFAIYWNEIEDETGDYEYDNYDETVRDDVIYGLKSDVILIGTPASQADSAHYIPGSLFEPVFDDGTDIPGEGKSINEDNPWAVFVDRTVYRYMPGGKLARQERWPEGAGVRYWEIWNEPDFDQFWSGSVEEYARLVKVAYLAARHMDPNAQIVVGGLALFEKPEFAYRLLDIYKNDPDPVDRRYPFNVMAVHSYSNPPSSFYAVVQIETLLAVHGLYDVQVWLNESGVAAWNDYPGPTWATRADQIQWRATEQEQAAYVIQNAAFAFLAGADKVFHFQLYDDCGNQPRGTTFAPHDGSLCDTGAICVGDALGLLRNESSNVCFNQHPQPGTPRPAYHAFNLAAVMLGPDEMIPLTGYMLDGRWRVVFAKPSTGEIFTLLWDESGQPGEMAIGAHGTQTLMTRMDGYQEWLAPNAGTYHIRLDPATNQAQSPGSPYTYMIGGPPVFVAEQTDQSIVCVLPLLDLSRTAALVKWRSNDPGITRYEIYYRDDSSEAGEWVRWIETDRPGDEIFAAGIGRSYSFFARGLTADGQWTADQPYAQAWTTLQ